MSSSCKLHFNGGLVYHTVSDLIKEEVSKIEYSSKVKSLKDMTAKEIKEIEKTYNAKVVMKIGDKECQK